MTAGHGWPSRLSKRYGSTSRISFIRPSFPGASDSLRLRGMGFQSPSTIPSPAAALRIETLRWNSQTEPAYSRLLEKEPTNATPRWPWSRTGGPDSQQPAIRRRAGAEADGGSRSPLLTRASFAGATLIDAPLDRVDPNPRQPRDAFDEDALQELAASIEAVGVLQPI